MYAVHIPCMNPIGLLNYDEIYPYKMPFQKTRLFDAYVTYVDP